MLWLLCLYPLIPLMKKNMYKTTFITTVRKMNCLEKRPARHINFSGKNFSLENIHDKNLIHVSLNQNNDLRATYY